VAAEGRRAGARFFGVAGLWLLGLVALALLYQMATWPDQWGSWSPGEAALFLPGWLGLLLPAAAFAGGLAVAGVPASRGLALRGALLAVLTYGLLAYGDPVAEYHWLTSLRADAVAQYPFGPYTPGGLSRARDAVRENPPEAYSFRSSRPLESPPNWWTYQIHSFLAVALFTFLAAFLGRETGLLTRAHPPPLQANARWGLGLVTVVAFFGAESLGQSWVQSDPENSGVVGGWIPLAVPLLELVILTTVVRKRAADLGVSAPSGVP
jgi:hypothetical protein